MTKQPEISICKLGNRAILKIGDEMVAVKSYRISSSMHGFTELEFVLELHNTITEFVLSAKKELPQPQSQTATNDAP